MEGMVREDIRGCELRACRVEGRVRVHSDVGVGGRVEGGGWRLEGGGRRVEGGGRRVEGGGYRLERGGSAEAGGPCR